MWNFRCGFIIIVISWMMWKFLLVMWFWVFGVLVWILGFFWNVRLICLGVVICKFWSCGCLLINWFMNSRISCLILIVVSWFFFIIFCFGRIGLLVMIVLVMRKRFYWVWLVVFCVMLMVVSSCGCVLVRVFIGVNVRCSWMVSCWMMLIRFWWLLICVGILGMIGIFIWRDNGIFMLMSGSVFWCDWVIWIGNGGCLIWFFMIVLWMIFVSWRLLLFCWFIIIGGWWVVGFMIMRISVLWKFWWVWNGVIVVGKFVCWVSGNLLMKMVILCWKWILLCYYRFKWLGWVVLVVGWIFCWNVVFLDIGVSMIRFLVIWLLSVMILLFSGVYV